MIWQEMRRNEALLLTGNRTSLCRGQTPLKKRQPRSSKNRRSADLLVRKLARPALVLERDDLLLLLRAAVEREGNQSAFARRHGLERTALNFVLRGKRPVTDFHAKVLGLRRVYVAG